MERDEHHARAFFGRRKGHKLRPRQAELIRDACCRGLRSICRSPAPADLTALFPVPVTEVALEIGFGGGETMIAQATARPQTGFIGVEPFVNGMAKALAAIESAGLQNIRLHFDDATGLIAWLPDASLARIDLIHPDPWPKRRHWKRRFVQDATIARLARILRPRRRIPFRHRCRRLRRLDAAAFLAIGRFRVDGTMRRRLAKAWPDFTRTRYHAKAAREQRPPCFLIFRRASLKRAYWFCRTCQKRTTRCAVDADSRP